MEDGGIFQDYFYYEDARVDKSKYIYLDTDKRILKFVVKIDKINIAEAIKNSIANISVYDYKVEEKRHAQCSEVPLKFLPKVGKFKLGKNINRTQNYLVPNSTPLLELLNKIYKNNRNDVCAFTRHDLNKLYEIMNECYANKKYNDIDTIFGICSNLNVELVDEFDMNKESISKTIKNVEALTFNRETFETLSDLSLIMNSLNSNLDQIIALNLENKFIQAVQLKKQSQKVK